MDLHAYREQAEAFRTELDRAYYRHFAGHDASLELEPIYRRHSGLFTRDAVLALQEQAAAANPGTDAQRRARMLWDFALEGCLGPGVTLDLESRPGKTPRAFCAPVRVPAEVYLVLTPIGGREDYAILFHEGGHTEQFAHTAPELAFEFRYLGDAAATETFAFLLQHVTDEPGWQARHLAVQDPPVLAAAARASRFVYLRQYTAKLSYELELHGGSRPPAEMGTRYSELLGAGLGIPWSC